jgi:hypothetical protein
VGGGKGRILNFQFSILNFSSGKEFLESLPPEEKLRIEN